MNGLMAVVITDSVLRAAIPSLGLWLSADPGCEAVKWAGGMLFGVGAIVGAAVVCIVGLLVCKDPSPRAQSSKPAAKFRDDIEEGPSV